MPLIDSDVANCQNDVRCPAKEKTRGEFGPVFPAESKAFPLQ
jgi:hypothetical protein